jgi:hypothetical protein
MFKMGSSIILACLSIFISEMPVHAQSAPDTVKLVCHELNGSAPSDITGNKLGEIIHFVSLNLKEKTANIDDNSKFKNHNS